MPVHIDGFSYRFDICKQTLRDVSTEYGNRSAAPVFLVGEKAAAAHLDLALLGVFFLDAHEIDARTIIPLVLRCHDLVVADHEHWRHSITCLTLLANIKHVFVGEIFSSALFPRQRVGTQPKRKFIDQDRVRAEALQHRGDRRVEAGQYRTHANDGASSHDYAQNGQERSSFVRTDGLESKR